MSMAITWRTPAVSCRLKPIAAADRSDLQMERSVLRMPAIVQERLRSLMLLPNLSQLGCSGVGFAEMGAQPALAVLYMDHGKSPPGRFRVHMPCQAGIHGRSAPEKVLQ